MRSINLQCQMVKFGKSVEKLTTIQSISFIIWKVKYVTKKKHILGKQQEPTERDSKVE